MKVMIRRTEKGLSAYVPKKDLEEPIVSCEREIPLGRRGDSAQRLGARVARNACGDATAHHRRGQTHGGGR